MSDFSRMRCLDEFKLSSLSTPSDRSLDEAIPLPSATMSTAEYVRIHANIPPSKLREIIKKQVFPRDDVEYLKRIVGDIGDLEYVFRFLWWDGPKATSFDEWDDTPINFPQSRTCTAGWNESPTRGETNWGSSAYHGSRRRAATDTSRSTNEAQLPSVHSSSKFKDANRRGRTWIQYCCYYNAHQCLQWIFHEIVRNHLQKFNREQERQLSASSEHGLQGSLTRQTNSRKLSKEGDGVHIIHQVLEYPSHCYSATNYVAVSAIRNSSDCLYLLLQRGGLDPNMKINSHGSTAAHLAAWKNNVECLQVLKSGCCSDGNEDSFDEEFISQSSTSLDNKSEDGEEHIHNDSFSSASPIRTWSADWHIMNDQGETPIHVAAREGCCESMQFFLDLAISFAEAEAMRNSYCHDGEISSRPHCLSEDGIRELGQHLDKPDHASRPPVDFSLRNKEGMDCTGLASKNNHAKIIEALANCIQQLKEIDEEASRDIKPSVSDGIWNNQQSLLETVSQDQDRTVLKPPPQSHLKSLRRRANTDPVRSHAELKLPKTSVSEHKINNQSSLPSYYPSLNRHNPQEKNNHEAPIHVAARQGNLAAIKALFESGYCDISGRDSMGQTALHIAVLAFHSDVIQFFAGLSLEQFKVSE